VSFFDLLIIGHIIAGTVTLISFWGPVIHKKGSPGHLRWGRVFVRAIYAAAIMACVMGILNLLPGADRHPTLTDRALFHGLFGWMMLYLGVLSLLLTRYGVSALAARRKRLALTDWPTRIGLIVTALAALQCGAQGWLLGNGLMMGLAALGLVTVITFGWQAMKPSPTPQGLLAEHLKAMIAAGISAYTAFLSVGLLRIVPEHVFNPMVWSAPSVVGVMLIIHHLKKLRPIRPESA
jgi:hypothetical protein